MKGRMVLVALGLLVGLQDASATTIRRLEFVALNYYAMQTWCTGQCLEKLAQEFEVDVSDPTNIEINGFIEVRGQYVRWGANERSGTIGGFTYQINENSDVEYNPLCEAVADGFSDTMDASFGFADADGWVASGTGLLCGIAADGPNGFESAESEFGYWRDPMEGDGWFLMARVASVTERVPEPGTLALLSFGLVGLGLSRRKKAA